MSAGTTIAGLAQERQLKTNHRASEPVERSPIPYIRWTPDRSRGHRSGMVETTLNASDRLSIVALERVDPEKNVFRYYVLSVEPTLFDEVSLVREWGRVGQRGRRIVQLCPDEPAAKVDLETWLTRKRLRGYEARV